MQLILKWGVVILMTLAILVAGLILCGKIERLISDPPLYSGTVRTKCYYDGHPYKSITRIGSLTFTKRYQYDPYFYVEVVNGDHSDFWKVSEEEWERLSVGQRISRSFFSFQ